MIRRSFILVIALLLCAVVWWIGPLIAIGTYRPLLSVWVRGIIIALILCWALWPFVATFLSWVFRHARAPAPAKENRAARSRDLTFYDALRTLQYVGTSKQRTLAAFQIPPDAPLYQRKALVPRHWAAGQRQNLADRRKRRTFLAG